MQELHLTEYEPGVLEEPDSNEPIREIKPIEGYEPSEIIEMIGKMAQYGHAQVMGAHYSVLKRGICQYCKRDFPQKAV